MLAANLFSAEGRVQGSRLINLRNQLGQLDQAAGGSDAVRAESLFQDSQLAAEEIACRGQVATAAGQLAQIVEAAGDIGGVACNPFSGGQGTL